MTISGQLVCIIVDQYKTSVFALCDHIWPAGMYNSTPFKFMEENNKMLDSFDIIVDQYKTSVFALCDHIWPAGMYNSTPFKFMEENNKMLFSSINLNGVLLLAGWTAK